MAKRRTPAQIAASKRNLQKARAARSKGAGTKAVGGLKYSGGGGPIGMSGAPKSAHGNTPTLPRSTGILGRKSGSIPKVGKVTASKATKAPTVKKVTTATIAKSGRTPTKLKTPIPNAKPYGTGQKAARAAKEKAFLARAKKNGTLKQAVKLLYGGG